ncbi:hypothetical protein [Mixta calida]|nr:hypothetical protein [Mixta calida]
MEKGMAQVKRVFCFCCREYKEGQSRRHYADVRFYPFDSGDFQALEQVQVKRLTKPIPERRGVLRDGLKKTIP